MLCYVPLQFSWSIVFSVLAGVLVVSVFHCRSISFIFAPMLIFFWASRYSGIVCLLAHFFFLLFCFCLSFFFSMDSTTRVKFTGKNYSIWAFQFEFFLMGKDLWGHIDGTDVAQTSNADKSKDVESSPSWDVLDARIMYWLLGSMESHIFTNLRHHRSAQSMWTYLKKVYHQDNDAHGDLKECIYIKPPPGLFPSSTSHVCKFRRFQLEHTIAIFEHGNLSIQDYYSAFLTLWNKYSDLVTLDVPDAALSTIQKLHETSRRDHFLMKLLPEYEYVRSSLLNKSPIPSLNICFDELLREEQHFRTQATLDQSHDNLGTVAYATQGCRLPMHSKHLSCFCCKEYGYIDANCPKKYCSYCKKKCHIFKECHIHPQNRQS
ncbi:uncharacterized protein LOC121251993 [Juglans microcarpa x Juglans regia]|uniref:uncharacterized protein LOC121251993 n=1 Tax=Juglans microcarpa x Juglans regia TaxID=2249226 RepID=UPI001B7E4EB7|nr:uncharacterized protein LOC121251993 [Juglans microcarpa x Juglans regia]